MKIEDVKQWQCGNGNAVAINNMETATEADFYIRKSEGISWGDHIKAEWFLFEDWRLDPANQPVTDLSGIYNSEQVKEVLEVESFNIKGYWRTINGNELQRLADLGRNIRRRLVLDEYDKTENTVYGPCDHNYGRDNKIADLCNTDSLKDGKQEFPREITDRKISLGHNNNIEPCPFCGGTEGEQVFLGQTAPAHYQITCCCCSVVMKHDRKDKVIGIWNNRKPLEDHN